MPRRDIDKGLKQLLINIVMMVIICHFCIFSCEKGSANFSGSQNDSF